MGRTSLVLLSVPRARMFGLGIERGHSEVLHIDFCHTCHCRDCMVHDLIVTYCCSHVQVVQTMGNTCRGLIVARSRLNCGAQLLGQTIVKGSSYVCDYEVNIARSCCRLN